ncbi:hypothetical protein BIV23_24055 [Streptomyces monashensis]|uniref:Uncharacterized protein n=1 Tax=Streptomyces monashensis TaxID=1678012 RepID=A0A1S2QB14_9ACTN|nr:hypothetical protein BIV23_24055 [Streptomyces monashensis]
MYASAKEAAECIERGMSVKEAVQQARTTAPGGHDVTPQQVVQGIHDLMSAGPDEEMDAAEDGDRRQGPATR